MQQSHTDALLADDQKKTWETWIKQTASDAQTSEEDRKLALSIFIITERRTLPS